MLFILTYLCVLKKLQELDLYDNLIEGILPTCLNNMTSLRLLYISRYRFVGNISSYVIASATSLEYIDLSYNQFEGLFQFNIFAKNAKLQKDAKALFFIQQAVAESIFPRITAATKSKDAWDALQNRYQDNAKVLTIKL